MTATASPSGGKLWQAANDILSVIGPVTVVTGLLYYFGRSRAQSFYSYFGVDLSALNVTPFDFLISTADPVFRPTATVLVIALAVLALHLRYRGRWDRLSATWQHRVRFGVFAVSALSIGLAILGLYFDFATVMSAVAFVIAGLLFEYGVRLWPGLSEPSFPLLRAGLVFCIAFVGLFWTVSILAHSRGIDDARLFEGTLPAAPQAVVYSAKDLQLTGPYVHATPLSGPDSAYRYRYNGLRQLTYRNNRWFLLPAGWRRDNRATVFVIQDDPGSVRVDVAPGTLVRPR